MRGKVNIAAALAISVFAALSCSEREEPKKLNESILFNVAVSPATKAGEGSDAVYPSDIPFAVWAEGSDGTVLLDNTPCELTDRSYWQPVGGMLWPLKETSYLFYAASPFGMASYSEREGITFPDYKLSEGIDLLYTEPVSSNNKHWSNGVMPLEFKHALATLRFSARVTSMPNAVVTVKKISLNGVVSEGSFSSEPKASWRSNDVKSSQTLFEGKAELSENEIVLNPGTRQIPQNTLVQLKLLCDLVSGDAFLLDQEYEAYFVLELNCGKISHYLLNFSGGEIITIEKSKG